MNAANGEKEIWRLMCEYVPCHSLLGQMVEISAAVDAHGDSIQDC